VFRIDLAKTELCVIDIPASRTARKRGRRPDKERKRLDLGCSRHNLGGELSGDQIFLFFSQQPLKSPDSAKEIQGNARTFPCGGAEATRGGRIVTNLWHTAFARDRARYKGATE
jgi:hypothetical protein